ncbi:MAG: hypothetical protein K2G70_02715 [Turicibacter sp.]|nr:hypothetical protein [Turicibacter sp.]
MEKTRKIIKSFVILLFLACVFLIKSIIYAENGQEGEEIEILLVVDRSGSLQEEEKSIEQALGLLYKWVETETSCCAVDVVVFADKAVRTQFANLTQVPLNRNITSMVAGMSEADLWIEEKLANGKKVYVIVISDLVESPSVECTMEEAEEKQENINTIIENWAAFKREGVLDYLFITWIEQNEIDDEENKEVKTLVELKEKKVEKVGEFRYTIVDRDRIHLLKVQKDAEAGEAVSQTEMAGQMLMEVLHMFVESDVKEYNAKYLRNNGMIYLGEYHEAMLLVENNVDVVSEMTKKTLSPMYRTDSLQVFHMDMDTSGKQFRVTVQEGESKKGSEIFCFYIPISLPEISYSTISKVAGSEFQIFCRMKNDYEEQRLVKPLKVVIYTNTGAEKKIEQEVILQFDEQEQCYTASICLEKAGTYTYEIKMADGKVIRTSELYVDSAKSK